MVDLRFGLESMSGVRFGVSPLLETTLSVGVLSYPEDAAFHLHWVEGARERVGDLDLTPLRLLLSRDEPRYAPDFLNPPPSCPCAELEEELAVMVATPPRQIREEVERCFEDRRIPEEVEEFITRPRRAIRALAETLREYWQRALSPHWPRISTRLDNDILYRSQALVDGGTRALFDELDPQVKWDGNVLRIEKDCIYPTVELDDRGLLLVARGFT